jgi:hypothetical protein
MTNNETRSVDGRSGPYFQARVETPKDEHAL